MDRAFRSRLLRRRLSRVSSKKLARFAIVVVTLIVVAAVITECDEVPDAQRSTSPTTRAAVPAGSGVVRGVVRFNAPRPVMKVIGGACCPGASPAVDESTVVNDDGTLANVVVYIKDGPNVAGANDTTPAVLDQKDCRYIPHVLAVRTNEPVDVTSHDPTMHNVHVQSSVNAAMNFSQTQVGASRRISFASPEVPVRVRCDVHPWMSAYVAVFDHPFFAVTGDDGAFQIERLPPGNYTLVAWHERYGSLEKQVTVSGASQSIVQVEFEYISK
jgi:hypothetical protein